jgi:FkbM family methyltransferase
LLSSIDFPCSFKDQTTKFKIFIYWYRDLPYLFGKSYVLEREVKDAINLILKFENVSKFWDVGGNIGYYSFFISSLLPKSEIIAFEPFHKNVNLFKRTIDFNRIKNIKLISKAVSNKSGSEEFLVDDISGATGQFKSLLRKNDDFQISNAYGLRKTIQVETIKLDEMIDDGCEVPDLMKVDIEEAEEMMFQGACKIIKSKKTKIVIETYNPKVLKLFKDNDYSIFLLDDSSNYAFIPNTSKQLINSFGQKYREA